jgi:hypothetical protein
MQGEETAMRRILGLAFVIIETNCTPQSGRPASPFLGGAARAPASSHHASILKAELLD